MAARSRLRDAEGATSRDSNAEAQRLYQEANDLKVRSSGIDAQVEQLDMRSQRAWCAR